MAEKDSQAVPHRSFQVTFSVGMVIRRFEGRLFTGPALL
jgi:hypothetical protein